MAKLTIKAGTTGKSVGLFFQDSTSTNGAGLAGLASNTASFICYWYQPGVTGTNAVTLAALASATAAFNSGGFFEIDSTHAKGHYRFDAPNAALTGASSSIFVFSGAANQAQLQLEFELTAVDNQSAATFMTGVNGIAPPTNWNLMSIDGSGRVVVVTNADKTGYTLTAGEHTNIGTDTQAGLTAQGYTTTRAGYLTGDSFVRLGAPTGASIAADLAEIEAETDAIGTDTSGVTTLLTRIPGTVQPQTGDSFARLGAAGAGLTAIGDARIGQLDAAVSSRLAASSYTVPPTVAQIDTQLSASHGAGAWNGGGGGSDPWLTAVPGTYSAGSSGYTLGHIALAGTGANIINQNQGGTNNLQPTIGSVAQPNVTIRAYLQSDFAAGRVTQAYVKDQTVTDSNGNWTSTMALASGIYAFTYNDNRDIYPASQNVTVP